MATARVTRVEAPAPAISRLKFEKQDIVWCGDVGGLEIHLHFAPGPGFIPSGLPTKGCI